MKKIMYITFFLTIFLILGFNACKKETTTTTTPAPAAPQVDPLKPDTVQYALAVEGTGVTCGYCPAYGTVMMKQMINKYPKLIAIALHANIPGPDALNALYHFNSAFLNNFSFPSVPGFYVGNQNAGQTPEPYITAALSKKATAGLKYTWVKDATKYNIKVRVQFFADTSGTFYIGTYALQDGIAAKHSKSLDQHDYMGILQTITSQDTTNWVSNQAPDGSGGYYFLAGKRYWHDHVLTAGVDGITSSWGQVLSKTSFNVNDTLNFNFTITPPISTSANPWTNDIDIVTILWQKVGSKYNFVNGYHKH